MENRGEPARIKVNYAESPQPDADEVVAAAIDYLGGLSEEEQARAVGETATLLILGEPFFDPETAARLVAGDPIITLEPTDNL